MTRKILNCIKIFIHFLFPQIIGIISVFFICVSIVSFCLKTHPDMRVPVIRNVTLKTSTQGSAWALDKAQTNAHVFFFYIECVCNAWFTFEFFVSVVKLSCNLKALMKFLFLSCVTGTFCFIAQQTEIYPVISEHN